MGGPPDIDYRYTGEDDEDFDDSDDDQPQITKEAIEMWDTFRQFFVSADGSLKLDFSNNLRKDLSLYQASVNEFTLNFNESKVLDQHDVLLPEEVSNLESRLTSMKG